MPGNRSDWQNLRNTIPYLWDYRGKIAAALFSLLLAKAATVSIPLLLKEIVDALNSTSANQLILPLALLLGYGGLRLASGLFNELRDVIFARVRYGVMRQISNDLLRHLHGLSLRFHLERKTGAISRDMERGARSISSLLNYMIFNIIPTLAEFLLVIGILAVQYAWQFTVITGVTILIYVLYTALITNWRMNYRYEMNTLESEANNQAIDSLINYETVKYFGNDQLEVARYNRTLMKWEESALKTQTSLAVLSFGQGAIIAAGVSLIMILAAQGVVNKTMSLGDLVLVNAFLLQLFIPLNFLGVVYRSIKYALADMELMFKVLAQAPEICDAPAAYPLTVKEGKICFQRVSFAYQPSRPILHEIDFTILPGKKVAVVGPSGAGKSTLARLLFRFYELNQGIIEIDQQDIRQVTQASLRQAIGIVPQDTVLFNDTIFYNIHYGNPAANREAVIRAAQLAHIHNFVESLPKGYDSVVGERGLKLSGGEKQRVAIARAILKDPKILIFDEATSSLDSQSEQMIQAALAEVAANRSTLVIAHRLSTIIDADEILVMEQGRIIERGRHPELLKKQGLYAQMWALQQEERQLVEQEQALEEKFLELNPSVLTVNSA